eukprot:Rmarinus@m.7163
MRLSFKRSSNNSEGPIVPNHAAESPVATARESVSRASVGEKDHVADQSSMSRKKSMGDTPSTPKTDNVEKADSDVESKTSHDGSVSEVAGGSQLSESCSSSHAPNPDAPEESRRTPPTSTTTSTPTLEPAPEPSPSAANATLASILGMEEYTIPPNEHRQIIWSQQVKKGSDSFFRKAPAFQLFLFSDLLLLCKPEAVTPKRNRRSSQTLYRVSNVVRLIDVQRVCPQQPTGSDSFPLCIVVSGGERLDLLLQSAANREHIQARIATAVVECRFGHVDPSTNSVEENLVETKYGALYQVLGGNIYSTAAHGDATRLLEYLNSESGLEQAQEPDDVNQALPLHYAALYGHADCVRLFLERGVFPESDAKSRSPLHLAAAKDHARVVREFAATSQDLNPVDGEGRTPLHYAVLTGAINAVPAILHASQQAAEIHDNDGRTPLRCAVENENALMVSQIILSGARARNRAHTDTSTYTTLLHTAASAGSLPVVMTLLKAGVQPNVRNADGCTPLFCAEDADIRRLLVRYGARLDVAPADTNVSTLFSPVELADLTRLASEYKYMSASTPYGGEIPPDVYSFKDLIMWVDDSSSNTCTLCEAPFTTTFRRHHCRMCGALVCANCHGKKFLLGQTISKDGLVTNNPPVASAVCDGCFNFLYLNNPERLPRAKSVQKQKGESDDERRLREEKERDLLLPPKSKVEIEADAIQDFDNCLKEADAARTKNIMEENKRKMLEQQEKLRHIADRSEVMRNEANDFAANCRKLREQQQKNASWFGLF